MPQISVIVPVYKVELYLRRCVDSILAQTFSDFELILVDDGSPDGCPAICDEYATQDSRVRVIHQENGGLSAARNAGIDWVFANSDSEWISFVDSDDWVRPEYLERLLSVAMDNHVDISICGYAETTGEEPKINPEQLAPRLWNVEEFFVAHNVNATIACGKLYKKQCFENIRYPVGKLHEDEFTTYRVLFALQYIAVIPEALYLYYVNNSGITKSAWNLRRMDAYTALEENIRYFTENGFNIAKRFVIRRYLQSVSQKMRENSNNKEIARALRAKKRTYFNKYAKHLNFDDDADAWVLSKIYPIRMKVYWLIRALQKHIL